MKNNKRLGKIRIFISAFHPTKNKIAIIQTTVVAFEFTFKRGIQIDTVLKMSANIPFMACPGCSHSGV